MNDNQRNGEIDESVVSVNSSRAFSYALTPMGILVNAMPVAIVQCRASMEYSSTRSSTVAKHQAGGFAANNQDFLKGYC